MMESLLPEYDALGYVRQPAGAGTARALWLHRRAFAGKHEGDL